jgi:hypothetical protein
MKHSSEATGFTESLSITRFVGDSAAKINKPIVREYPLTIILNGCQLATMLCSPDSLQELAVGFLASEGLLQSKDEIESINIDQTDGIVKVQTTDKRDVSLEIQSKRPINTSSGRGTFSPRIFLGLLAGPHHSLHSREVGIQAFGCSRLLWQSYRISYSQVNSSARLYPTR